MNLRIITPERNIFEGVADLVQLPGSDGSFEIMKNHAPLIATLTKGSIKVGSENNFQYFEINGGVVEVLNNTVLVLAE